MLTKDALSGDSFIFINLNGMKSVEIQEQYSSAEARKLLSDSRREQLSVRSLRALIKRAGWQPQYMDEMRRHELLKFLRDVQE